jgi:nucleotide-binding universal stress UspA family protein
MGNTMIKDIAIHLTGSNEDQIRIEHAAALARCLDAHLTGLQVHEMPEVLTITDPAGSGFLQALMADSVDRAAAVTERVRAQLDATGINHELRRLDLFPGQLASALAAEVRASDLFVGTRPYGDPGKQQRVEEAVLFESGRPCMFVPPGHRAPASYPSVLVAWKNTREAAVAVAAAMPVLQAAQDVRVAIVEEDGVGEQRGEAVGEEIGRYLSRHGVSGEVRLIGGWNNVSAAILNEAGHAGADLIVLGAYGHSRMREWALGGVTRDVLSQSPVPILTAR